MKRVFCIFLLCCFGLKLSAQVDTLKKPATLVFHAFYNDFKTAQQLKTISFSKVQWSSISDMQMGFGFNYIKGITHKIDFVGTLDGSYTDYLFKNGTSNGSSEFLLDANAGVNLKLLTDNHPVVPYLFGGGGFSLYKGNAGFYVPVGAGLQFNLFNEAYVLTSMQYRVAVTPQVNNHFQYNIGIGVNIGKKKKTQPPVKPAEPVKTVVQPPPVVVKIITKDILITVFDEQTGLPLPGVEVSIDGPAGKQTGVADASGQVTFNAVKADDYTISGSLHGIATTTQHIEKTKFDAAGDNISINLSHNDPRFTLTGQVNNKTTGKPEAGVTVNIANITQNSNADTQSGQSDGAFAIQLEPGSDFTVSGKKAGYISNIEKVSTKGLNRSTTLYVKLSLNVEEALPDKAINLSNLYYDTGSSKIRPGASSDLEKLVKFLKDNPGLRIEIASHTDSRGNALKNLKLSQARAQEVVNYLQKNGIDKGRLVPKGYGATKLVNGCKIGVKCTDAQHEQNRRTEFKVIGN